tara:strand:- start:28776 stop:30230 length:1455 start_codon:yes stop_codon:yes gene_type:complete
VTKEKIPVKRIEFLAKKFDVFDQEEFDEMSGNNLNKDSRELYEIDGCIADLADTGENILYAIHTWNERKYKNTGELVVGKVRVYEDTFIKMVQSDPTDHKEYVQWMLTTFVRFIKEDKKGEAIRFASEDLEVAAEYLELFHSEKHKPKFKKLCSGNSAFKDIRDPSNINQYRDLSHLFDAVDPYIDKNASKLEKDIRILTRLGHGKIPYEDRRVMVFIPKTIKASRLFANFSRWCTTSNKETFNSYTGQKTPKKTLSCLYIVIPKTYLLTDEDLKKTDELYQLHFESGQYMDKSDRGINLDELISDNVGLSNYFYDLLIGFARSCHKNYYNNNYSKALKKFGFTDIIFEVLPPNTDEITILEENLGSMKNIEQFKNLQSIIIRKCIINEIPESIGDLEKLGNLSLPNNNLTKLPNSIGKLKNLTVINISGNYIEKIPETIKELDSSNGGILEYFSYGSNYLSDELISNLKEWLPNVIINEFKGL